MVAKIKAGRMTLNIRTVIALKPRDDSYVVWDGDMKGFGVRITPSGKRTFFLKYVFAGQQRWLTIGVLGDITVQEARDKASEARGEVSGGIDPQAAKDETRNRITMRDAWAEFSEFRAAFPFRRRSRWSAKTAIEYAKSYRLYIDKPLGGRAVASITDADAEDLRAKLKTKEATANCAIRYLSSFMSWAIEKRKHPGPNPCRNIELFEIKPRERVLNNDEFHRLMTAIDAYDGNVFVKAALKLYLATACRREELLTLRWDDVNFETNSFRLKDAKTGDRTIELDEAAVAILRSLPRFPGNPYVFCGQKTGQHLVNIWKSFSTVLTNAGIEDVRIHDLRRTFGSNALEAGVDIYTLSHMLGHGGVTTTQRAYAFLPQGHKRQAAEKIAEHQRKLAAGRNNVVALKRPA